MDHITEKHDDSWRGTIFAMRLFWRLCEKVIIECGQANLLDARDVTRILYTLRTERLEFKHIYCLPVLNNDTSSSELSMHTRRQDKFQPKLHYTQHITVTHSPQCHPSSHPLYDSSEEIVHQALQSPQLYPVYKSDIIFDVSSTTVYYNQHSLS